MLLPRPRSVTGADGVFTFAETDAVAGPEAAAAIVRRLLGPGTGLALPARRDGRIRLRVPSSASAEAYRLEVTPDRIDIAAADLGGVNWAVQTLRQLLPPVALLPASRPRPLRLSALTVEDGPRFRWRGIHLDTARHYVPLSDLFRYVDLFALHKFNVLQLHLTDDQGWRFESRRYPRLQEIAAWRRETRREDESGDGTPHGGFYRQDQLRALVGYAAERGLSVVPELEFPGHVRALLAAYPELGHQPGRHLEPATTFGVFEEVLKLDDQTMRVVFDLYAELLKVFPSRYIHVGGDECPTTQWLASPRAAELAARRRLSGPGELQRWFTGQLRDWLAERGRILVGWDEIASAGPIDGAVVMAWRAPEFGVRAAELGMDVVMAPARATYFDYYSSSDRHEPYAIGGQVSVEDAYAFDPLAGVPEPAHPRILGTQGQVWTEYLPDPRHIDYALFPRACALAEVAWSDPAERSWTEFRVRLEAHLERLDVLGVNYRPLAGPRPWQAGGIGRLARPLR